MRLTYHTKVIRVITAIFLRETLEAANNDAELMVQERARQTADFQKPCMCCVLFLPGVSKYLGNLETFVG